MAGVKKPVTTGDIKEAKQRAEKGYTELVSPIGVATTVPDEIVDVLVESGYAVKK